MGTGESLLERYDGRKIDLDYRFEGCGKVCKTNGGLEQDQKRVHRAPMEMFRFECGRCDLVCEMEVVGSNHARSC